MYITHFRIDEQKASHEPYLPNRKSTNILNTILIEEDSRITVTKLFINSLISQGKQCLITEFHLN